MEYGSRIAILARPSSRDKIRDYDEPGALTAPLSIRAMALPGMHNFLRLGILLAQSLATCRLGSGQHCPPYWRYIDDRSCCGTDLDYPCSIQMSVVPRQPLGCASRDIDGEAPIGIWSCMGIDARRLSPLRPRYGRIARQSVINLGISRPPSMRNGCRIQYGNQKIAVGDTA
jgi:hypothetical protein